MLRLQLLLDVFKRLFFTKRTKGYETTINNDRIIYLDRPVEGCSEPVGGGYVGGMYSQSIVRPDTKGRREDSFHSRQGAVRLSRIK